MKRFGCAVLAISILAATPSLARDGDPYTFEVVNGTTAEATGIYLMMRNGQYSRNILTTRLPTPGVRMFRFPNNDDDRCEIRLKVTFSDGDVFEQVIDFCAIDGVLLENTGMTGY